MRGTCFLSRLTSLVLTGLHRQAKAVPEEVGQGAGVLKIAAVAGEEGSYLGKSWGLGAGRAAC